MARIIQTEMAESAIVLLDRKIALSDDLSLEAKGLAFMFKALPRYQDFSKTELQKLIGIKYQKLTRILDELAEAGYFKVEKPYSKKKKER